MGTPWISRKGEILEKGGVGGEVDLEKGGGYDSPYQLYPSSFATTTFK